MDARAIVGMVAVALHFLFPKIFILTLSFSLALALWHGSTRGRRPGTGKWLGMGGGIGSVMEGPAGGGGGNGILWVWEVEPIGQRWR